jgi:hypothetical protein
LATTIDAQRIFGVAAFPQPLAGRAGLRAPREASEIRINMDKTMPPLFDIIEFLDRRDLRVETLYLLDIAAMDVGQRKPWSPLIEAGRAEMLRLAVIFGREEGIKICATIHHAILIEATLDEMEEQTVVMQSHMAEANWLVLDGFELGSEAEYTRYPEAFGGRQSPTWDRVQGVIGGRREH